MPYNATEYPWEQIKLHLLGSKSNTSLDIEKLKQQITSTFNNIPPVLCNTDFYNTLSTSTSFLNPKPWVPHTMASYALICLFVIVLKGFRTLCARAITAQKAGVTTAAAVLALEKKREEMCRSWKALSKH